MGEITHLVSQTFTWIAQVQRLRVIHAGCDTLLFEMFLEFVAYLRANYIKVVDMLNPGSLVGKG
jgi:hypothetical protein